MRRGRRALRRRAAVAWTADAPLAGASRAPRSGSGTTWTPRRALALHRRAAAGGPGSAAARSARACARRPRRRSPTSRRSTDGPPGGAGIRPPRDAAVRGRRHRRRRGRRPPSARSPRSGTRSTAEPGDDRGRLRPRAAAAAARGPRRAAGDEPGRRPARRRPAGRRRRHTGARVLMTLLSPLGLLVALAAVLSRRRLGARRAPRRPRPRRRSRSRPRRAAPYGGRRPPSRSPLLLALAVRPAGARARGASAASGRTPR